jgi:hypothetical protein
MNDTLSEQDKEIAAIAAISAALSSLADTEARRRVLSYVLSRYLPDFPVPVGATVSSTTASIGRSPTSLVETPSFGHSPREIPGVIHITDAGELKITARDLKAKSGLDAAVRLAYLAIYASEKLTGQPLSSPKSLTPLLKQWRLYDGNTRTRLAKDKGIIRSGENLSLDAHGKLDAERFIEEILNPEVQGQWRPR